MADFDCKPHLGDGWILESGSEPQAARDWKLANRRDFIKRVGLTAAGLTCADFLGFFGKHGMADETKFAHKAKEIAGQAEPRFLVYWFLEGGWDSYDMFSPVVTPNNIYPDTRLPSISDEKYRVLDFGKEGKTIKTLGNIRYGFLAEAGTDLFKDLAVVSSMETGSGHSAERLRCHMGHYNFSITGDREENERSVTQAFAEVYGQPYPLPNLSWHYWLSDGELNEVQYTGRKGYYHALGPVHAHTIYAGTPDNLRQFLMRMYATSNDVVNAQIQDFLAGAGSLSIKDEHIEACAATNPRAKFTRIFRSKGKALDKPDAFEIIH